MSSEGAFWRGIVRPALQPYGLVERIENAVGLGMADVNYCLLGVEGWIELKYLPSWPARPLSPVWLRHFNPNARTGIDQLRWHERRATARSRTCLLIQIAREYIVIGQAYMSAVFYGVPRASYYEQAVVKGQGTFPTVPIVKYLTGRGPAPL